MKVQKRQKEGCKLQKNFTFLKIYDNINNMKSEKFNKIPEIFNKNKESLEKVLGNELTFHEKKAIKDTWQISGTTNENGEKFLLTLNNFDGEFAYNITLVTAEGSNVLIFNPEEGIEKAKELKSMIEILAEIS